MKREGRPDPAGVVFARYFGTLSAIENSDWPHFKQWPQWAEGLEPRDLMGLTTDRVQELERAAASLKPFARTQALCALASVSEDVVRRLVLEWQSSYRWLYHDNIVAQALGRASPQARRRLLASLRDHASSIADTSDAIAFAAVAASGDTVDRELLLDLVRALPDGTLRAHIAWHVAHADPALRSAAGIALSEARGTAAQLVRAAWAEKRWAAWPEDVDWTSPESEMRQLLFDVLPQLLAPGFQDDPYIVALLRDQDWLKVLRKVGQETLTGFIEAPFASEKQDTERRLAMRAAIIARRGDFRDLIGRFPELRQSAWACAIGTGLSAEEVPRARAAIEALLEPYGDKPRVLGTSFHGWKLLVHGLVAEHPDSIGWFTALLRRHEGQLNRFDFLPALARFQRAEAIEALSAEGVSAGNICLMLLAADDPATRKLGHGRLAELLRAGSPPPLLGTRYEDDAPFTARALLGGLLAECEDPQTLKVAMKGLRREAVRWYAEPVEASIDISSLLAEVLRRAPDAMALPLADIVCETMTEFLG